MRAPSLKLLWKSWPLCPGRLLSCSCRRSEGLRYGFQNRGSLIQLSSVQRKLLCGRNYVGFFLQEGKSSSFERGLLPSSQHSQDPLRFSGFYSVNPVQGGSHPVASEIGLEYLETFGYLWYLVCERARALLQEFQISISLAFSILSF